MRVAEYSGLTGRKGTALRSVTNVLWFCVVSHTAGRGSVGGAPTPMGWGPGGAVPPPAGCGAGRTQARARGQRAGLGAEPRRAGGNDLPQPHSVPWGGPLHSGDPQAPSGCPHLSEG